MRKLIHIILFLGFLVFIATQTTTAQDVRQEEILEGVVTSIIEEKEIYEEGQKRDYQKLKFLVEKGSLKGKEIVIENGRLLTADNRKYKEGDHLVISYSKGLGGEDVFFIADYVRRNTLLFLFILFIVVSVSVTKVWGATSLLGMAFSFLIIFKFILPLIVKGADPILIAITGSTFIIPVTFYLSHGFNKKTHTAIVGTIIALIITGILATVFIEIAQLTGFASEEAGFLQFEKENLNMKGILLAGIIIGTLGVLDDVTVSQSAIVFQLRELDKNVGIKKLYSRAMRVGRDHITSMINTLVLVYTGASMPLFLLFINNPRPFSEIINYELIADEIIRTLVGSIGLVLAVPITTLLAVLCVCKSK